MGDLSIIGAIARLAEITIAVKIEEHEAMKRAVAVVQTEAQQTLGTYQGQAGQFVAWRELADATKADRLRQGYSENDPGLRSGEMRADIGTGVSEIGAPEAEGVIGSNDDKMVFFELGTKNQPPRSDLGGAAFRKGEEVSRILGAGVMKALVGDQVFGGSLPIP